MQQVKVGLRLLWEACRGEGEGLPGSKGGSEKGEGQSFSILLNNCSSYLFKVGSKSGIWTVPYCCNKGISFWVYYLFCMVVCVRSQSITNIVTHSKVKCNICVFIFYLSPASEASRGVYWNQAQKISPTSILSTSYWVPLGNCDSVTLWLCHSVTLWPIN